MAVIPEFISLLRSIRDEKFPQMSNWFTSISAMNSNVTSIEANIEAIQTDVTNKNNTIKSISVLNPVTTVPNKPNGSAGDASVIYNANTNQFTFGVPAGEKGDSMRIDYTVTNIADKYSLTVNVGDIVFAEENNSIYIKLDTGGNAGESDWSVAVPFTPATTFTGLSDTPADYTGQHGRIPVVSSSEAGMVFKTGAEIGVIGYNYVKNPLFDNPAIDMTVLTNVAFGTDERGYGTFTTFVGTPSIASNNVRVVNGVTIANTSAYTIGKSAIGVRVQIDTLVPNSTIVDCGNMKLFINGSNKFAVTNGTTTNSMSAGLNPNVTDIFEIFATDQELIVLNKTTGQMATSKLSLTIASQSSGSVILGGAGMVAKYFAITILDKSTYTQVDGLYTEFARKWTKASTGGELTVMPDIEGADKGFRFISGGLASVSKVRMEVGDGGQFSGKEVTISFKAFSSGVGANSVSVDFVTDRGSQVQTSRLVTQNIGSLILDIGVEKNYVATFTIDTLPTETFLDSDASDYLEFTLPASANFWIVVSKPKFEISSIQTDFTPQGAGNSEIDDNSTSTKKTWSSSKIQEIRALLQTQPYRNRIINGAMNVNQINGTTAVTPTASGYISDQWVYYASQPSKLTFQKVADAPSGFKYSTKITVASQYTSINGDVFMFGQNIEGQNLIDMDIGLSTAKYVSLSFWVKTSVQGTYSVSLQNNTNDLCYATTFNATSAWSKINKIIPLATFGTWDTSINRGILIGFGIGGGVNSLTSTLDSWQTITVNNKFRGSTSINLVNQPVGSTLNITGVQLEKVPTGATTGTDYEWLPYDEELRRCMRYYEVVPFMNWGYSAGVVTGAAGALVKFTAIKRVSPTAGTITVALSNGTNTYSIDSIGTSAARLVYNSTQSGIVGASGSVPFSAQL